MTRPVLQVVVASTRPGRVGMSIAEWFVARATEHGGFDVQLVDLAAVNLPMLDEPNHPRLRRYTHDHTRAWSATVARADAFVIVNPEYNYGFNAAVKNAIDYLFAEWQYTAFSFVSYGGVSAGLRAVQMLKQVLTALKMVPVQDAVSIPFAAKHIVDGRFEANEIMEQSATAMLDELLSVSAVLHPLREQVQADLRA